MSGLKTDQGVGDCPKTDGWKKGPLPAGTYNWGGVVPFDHDGTGFFFADFYGDHVIAQNVDGAGKNRKLMAHEVKAFNNCLCLPDCCE